MGRILAAGVLSLGLMSGSASAQDQIAEMGSPETDGYVIITEVMGGYIVTTSEGEYYYGHPWLVF